MADAIQAAREAAASEEAQRLHGLFVGQCEPAEYRHLIQSGHLRVVYTGAAGMLGLGRFRAVERAGAGEARDE